MFMDMMQYQYVWHKASVFNLEILMSKMHFALVDQSLKKSMKSWKKLSKIGTLAVMISVRNIDHKTVLNHLEKAEYKKKIDVWVPHDLTVKNLIDQTSICKSLLKRNEIEPFLKRLMNYGWWKMDYVRQHNVRKRSWSKQSEVSQTVAKANWRQEKWCAWRDWKGIVHYNELLSPDQTIESNFYRQQLERLRQAIESDQNWSIGKASSSIMTTPDPTHVWRPDKNWENLVGKFWCIHLMVLILHQTIICFDLYKTLLMV